MAKRDQDVRFLASKEEVERIHEKMDELGITRPENSCENGSGTGQHQLDLQDVTLGTQTHHESSPTT